MKQGALIFDERTDRYDIRFDLADYYGGLHCGQCFDVMVGGRWKPTRIEYASDWYWKPLQIPHISPSRCCKSALTASLTAGLRKNAVMNFALPSGSSPPENPPGNAMI